MKWLKIQKSLLNYCISIWPTWFNPHMGKIFVYKIWGRKAPTDICWLFVRSECLSCWKTVAETEQKPFSSSLWDLLGCYEWICSSVLACSLIYSILIWGQSKQSIVGPHIMLMGNNSWPWCDGNPTLLKYNFCRGVISRLEGRCCWCNEKTTYVFL